MKEYLTPHSVANDVRMTRSDHKGAMLIVEGSLDARVYRNLVAQTACRIVVAYSKDNACGAIAILDKDDFEGALCIVDADFDHLENKRPSSKNVLLTDYHDLECMILASAAFSKVLAEYADGKRVEEFERQNSGTLAVILAKNTMPIGYLLWHSLKNNIGLKFDGLKFKEFVDPDDLTVRVDHLIETVKNLSQKHHLEDADIKSGMLDIQKAEHDRWQVSRGHDIVELLSRGLRRTLAARNATEVSREALERSLRLAYEASHFRGTLLCKSMQDWESTHPGYRVFVNDDIR